MLRCLQVSFFLSALLLPLKVTLDQHLGDPLVTNIFIELDEFFLREATLSS